MSPRDRDHPAATARWATAGLSTAAALAVVAALAADADEPRPTVEVRVDGDVPDEEVARAVREWLAGRGTGDGDVEVRLLDDLREVDTTARAS